ncbi:asparagine synthase (glutamine-hydrolyzing) [Desulfovibrio sp. JC010]|uniref:asparagine synthase (glutamine-hydrolyzing) n=1 Tax=Desulfovibrio sp. JC010 TaxID=2593641 RepID=UPI0013D6FADD|nr:asparagine synthase (glutamine-hydrolyzing) [Desulfovibrio sp. JC010]NDV27509.1 asparagine synthase (glutamine-hydrolyzing) [Desulfovibrio sp. JC010]
MCGIAGLIHTERGNIPVLERWLQVVQELQFHRGPDAGGVWRHPDGYLGLAHRRLSIIDLSDDAGQPMRGHGGTTITFNGEIYNYIELRHELSGHWDFTTASDTEVILAAYDRWGRECVTHLRGMFAFAIWDEKKQRLFCARDRFGVKPFYYARVGPLFQFASEIKALLPLLPEIDTDLDALSEYLTFQYTIGEGTLFKDISQLLPGHTLTLTGGQARVERYWDIRFEADTDHSVRYFEQRLEELMHDSVAMHLRSDVEVGSYLSGGIDSSLMAILGARYNGMSKAFHGKFTCAKGYDESSYALAASRAAGLDLHQVDITADDFLRDIEKVIYHLDHPVAGPGSFPQYAVSSLAAEHVKVVLGGQGGDEIFGGYARYVLAYFEQCIKAAIDGTYKDGNFVVTAESIIPNLTILKQYKPMIKSHWKEGLFDPMHSRYLRLIDRAVDVTREIRWENLDRERTVESFNAIFNNADNVKNNAYFDKMTHYDFKCLLPALLHVEDRMSMAHGLESRVPFLDHPLIEFVATVPANVKFFEGHTKHLLRSTFADTLPDTIVNREDKMGFPVPLKEWYRGELREYVSDLFLTNNARGRSYVNSGAVQEAVGTSAPFSRKVWGLLCLEIWHTLFHDRAAEYRAMLNP